MTQPFNHYFIATSYNTYLVEDMRGVHKLDRLILSAIFRTKLNWWIFKCPQKKLPLYRRLFFKCKTTFGIYTNVFSWYMGARFLSLLISYRSAKNIDPMIDGLTREPVVCSGIRTNPGVPLSLVGWQLFIWCAKQF